MKNSENLFKSIAKVTGISKAKMLSRSRLWPIVEARMLFILFQSRRGIADEKIAWALGRKRPSIVKSRHAAVNYIGYSRTFKEKFSKLEKVYADTQSL